MRYAIALIFGVFLIGCELVSNDPETGLILGKSIDRLELGDSEKNILAKIGEPDAKSITIDYPGVEYTYSTGEHAGISLLVETAEGLGLTLVSVRSPYGGRSRNGIGVGSPHDKVVQYLGATTTGGPLGHVGEFVEFYVLGATSWSFVYSDSIVTSISMIARD